MRAWFERTGAALRQRVGLVPVRQPRAKVIQQNHVLTRCFVGRDGELTMLPIIEARDDDWLDQRAPLRDAEGRMHDW